ncbi:MAG: hypothetical protein CL607_07450 [Anaerolineaceae bacterium]|nr:hypothetical protein [Anaerolineaceae bacterium]
MSAKGIGTRIKYARESRKLSQQDLADRCKIGVAQIWRYENDKSKPGADHLVTLSKELFVSADYLLGLSDNPRGFSEGEELNEVQKELVSLVSHNDLEDAIKALGVLHAYMDNMYYQMVVRYSQYEGMDTRED